MYCRESNREASNKPGAGNQAFIEKLQSEFKTAREKYEASNGQFADSQKTFQSKLLTVLPAGEQYTRITRDFDNFFEKNFTSKNKFIASSMRFGQGIASEAGSYAILPISLNIESSEENFSKFLDFINSSGKIEDGGRIMDIQSIRISLPEEGSGGDLSYTVNINAYYRL